MYISFDGFKELLITLIKLFLVGVIAIVLFKVTWALLPYIVTGYVTLLIISYYQKNKRSNKSSI